MPAQSGEHSATRCPALSTSVGWLVKRGFEATGVITNTNTSLQKMILHRASFKCKLFSWGESGCGNLLVS